MKKLIFLLLLLPIGLMAQTKISKQDFSPYEVLAQLSRVNNITSLGVESLQGFTSLYDSTSSEKEFIYLPPASASITITINDSSSATLVDIRDTLCVAWGYTGNPNDNAAKLAFLKQVLINKIVGDYNAQKTATLVQDISISIN